MPVSFGFDRNQMQSNLRSPSRATAPLFAGRPIMVCNKHAVFVVRLELITYEDAENIGSFLG